MILDNPNAIMINLIKFEFENDTHKFERISGRPQISDLIIWIKKCFQVYFYIERRVLKTYKNTFQKYLKFYPPKISKILATDMCKL